MTARERVLEEALALPTEDRAFLADRLDQSLERERFASPAIAAAWTAEIDRRIEAYERGELRASMIANQSEGCDDFSPNTVLV
jgi:putative addiction module component (TIGR02574 family)